MPLESHFLVQIKSEVQTGFDQFEAVLITKTVKVPLGEKPYIGQSTSNGPITKVLGRVGIVVGRGL